MNRGNRIWRNRYDPVATIGYAAEVDLESDDVNHDSLGDVDETGIFRHVPPPPRSP